MRQKSVIPTFFIVLQILLMSFTVFAIPTSPYKFYSTMPDNSQYARDYNPAPAHGDYWGNMMCGPTSAKNSMVWLAKNNPAYKKLKQKIVGDQWVDMSHQEIIEEIAKKMKPGWDWNKDKYPGVSDDEFVTGKKAFAEARGLKLNIKWMKNTSLGLKWGTETVGEPTLKWIMKEIDDDEDVEISTPNHWVTIDVDTVWMKEWTTIAGYMCETFEDENGNGYWDLGEPFWDNNYLGLNLGTAGIYDSFLYINDPANVHDGWQLTEIKNGKLYVGSLGYIETVVSESPVPEPASITSVLLGLGSLGLWKRGK
ncbi:MAG: PEP-CTERM sorting domain-containing protein [Planctomycetes bacterium]|nr:PEP-CTERM sorting domain-containing protein [Planctomycetota bacterium]